MSRTSSSAATRPGPRRRPIPTRASPARSMPSTARWRWPRTRSMPTSSTATPGTPTWAACSRAGSGTFPSCSASIRSSRSARGKSSSSATATISAPGWNGPRWSMRMRSSRSRGRPARTCSACSMSSPRASTSFTMASTPPSTGRPAPRTRSCAMASIRPRRTSCSSAGSRARRASSIWSMPSRRSTLACRSCSAPARPTRPRSAARWRRTWPRSAPSGRA